MNQDAIIHAAIAAKSQPNEHGESVGSGENDDYAHTGDHDETRTMNRKDLVQLMVNTNSQLLAPYIHSWPQALALLLSPANLSHSIHMLFHIADDLVEVGYIIMNEEFASALYLFIFCASSTHIFCFLSIGVRGKS